LGGVYVGTTAVTFREASPAAGVSLGVAFAVNGGGGGGGAAGEADSTPCATGP